MLVRQVWEGCEAYAWVKNLDGRTKLSFLFLFAILCVTIDNPRTLFIVFSICLCTHFLAGTPLYKWRVLAVLLVLGLWGSMFSQALFYAQSPRTILLTIISPQIPVLGSLTGGLFVYQEGILYGAVQGLRSASMLTIGLLICWVSDPRQQLKALMMWKMSPKIAFMLVTAIRFLPVLVAETAEVIIALQLRSPNAKGRNAVVRYLPYIVKPLLARCLRRAQTLALSVVSRGFFSCTARRKSEVWLLRERLACYGFGFLVLGVVISKMLFILNEQGLYFGIFRLIYDWTSLYL